MIFSSGGKSFSYGSTRIEEIIDTFLKREIEDSQCNHAEGKSNGFEELEDLRKELQTLNEKERRQTLMYMIMHPAQKYLQINT